jgi:hypothetical protein
MVTFYQTSGFTSHKMQLNKESISVSRKTAVLGVTIMFPIRRRKYSSYHGSHAFFIEGKMTPVDEMRETCSFSKETSTGVLPERR